MYGYLPPSSHLVVTPEKADDSGFVDASPHRAALPSAYQGYLFTGSDPFYRPGTEDIQMLLRPLFFTSFLIDDQLDDEGLTVRGPIVISSASSKTAIAAAYLLAQREGVEMVGLTSSRSTAFVEGLGIYGRTVAYDAIDSLERGPATFVDIAGDGDVRRAVHSHFGDDLAHSMAVGVTHWEDTGAGAGAELPGPAPALFFAPDRVTKRSKDWGAGKLSRDVADAWHGFCEWICRPARRGPRRGLRGSPERIPRRAGRPRGPQDRPRSLAQVAPRILDRSARGRREGPPKTREQRIAEQRRSLPDAPGVYLFRDSKSRVLYVGKAKSIRKRVAGHFSKSHTRAADDMIGAIESIEFVVTHTESEALLTEQEFIKRHRPRFNVRLRDDKSYPYIAISLDEDYPRVYFTRERHKRGRVYFGPFSNAKRVRGTLDLLGKVFQYRTCEGKEPGRLSGSPCLEYHIKRCQAPCIDAVSKEEYRENIETIIAFLSGRYREIERDLNESMKLAAADQEFEAAAQFRNKLRAVRSLLERQRVANDSVGTLDAVAVASEETDANAQVFQVREGVLADRQSFYLENAAQRDESEVLEEFVLQYYASSMSIPPQVIVPRGTERTEALAEALSERRGAAVEVRSAERGDKRRIFELAERNARLALDQDRLRSERRRSQRIEALDGLQEALGMSQIPMRIECFDISNLGETHTVASMVVFEGGAPKKSDYRRFKVRELGAGRLRGDGGGARAGGWPSTARSARSPRTRRSTTRASRRCRR